MPVMQPPQVNAIDGLMQAISNMRKPSGFAGMPVSQMYGPQNQTLDQLNQQYPEGVMTTPGQPSNRVGDDAVFRLIQELLQGSGDPGLDAMDMVGPMGMARQASKPLRRVFQGSPHKIPAEPGYPMGRFKDEFIGTGEGNAAFGEGHYQAELKKVAEEYRNRLSKGIPLDIEDLREYFTPGRKVPSPQGPYFGTDEVLGFNEGADGKWTVDVRAVEGKKVPPPGVDPQHITNPMAREGWETEWTYPLGTRPRSHSTEPDVFDVEKTLKRKTKKRGHLYESELKAPDEDFLVWDKPISQQSDKVKESLKEFGFDADLVAEMNNSFQEKIGKKYGVIDYSQAWGKMNASERSEAERLQKMLGSDIMGREVYHHLERNRNKFGGHDYPTDAGSAKQQLEGSEVRGIRFLEGFSRGKGKGTSNFVVFNPEDLEILKILGLAGVAYKGSQLDDE